MSMQEIFVHRGCSIPIDSGRLPHSFLWTAILMEASIHLGMDGNTVHMCHLKKKKTQWECFWL